MVFTDGKRRYRGEIYTGPISITRFSVFHGRVDSLYFTVSCGEIACACYLKARGSRRTCGDCNDLGQAVAIFVGTVDENDIYGLAHPFVGNVVISSVGDKLNGFNTVAAYSVLVAFVKRCKALVVVIEGGGGSCFSYVNRNGFRKTELCGLYREDIFTCSII